MSERMHPQDLRAHLAMWFYKLYIVSETDDPSHKAAIQEADAFLAELARTEPKVDNFDHQPGDFGTVPFDTYQRDMDSMTARAEAAEAERDTLKAWKESSMKEWADLDIQGIGKALGVRLGDSIPLSVLPKIQELKAQLAEARSDLELGFVEGAYARLKNLQGAEDRLASIVIVANMVVSLHDLGLLGDKGDSRAIENLRAALTPKVKP